MQEFLKRGMLVPVHMLCNLLLPEKCRVCAQSLAQTPGSASPPWSLVCDTCLDQICKQDHPVWTINGVPGHSMLWYEDHVAVMLKHCKELPDQALLRRLAARFALPALTADSLLVPVPPEPLRKRERGFDPVAMLTKLWARRAGLQQQGLLKRRAGSGKRRSQGLGERIHVEGFHLQGKALASGLGRSLVLVDDVSTSGSTLACCTSLLEEAGGKVTAYLTLCRTPAPGMKRSQGRV